MPALADRPIENFVHRDLANGVEFAADVLNERKTVALCFRMLTGLPDEPPELTGIGSIVERTLNKGTHKYDGRGLADAFDAIGAQWSSASGRQTMLVRVLCLPEYMLQAVDLVAELIGRPTFPEDACRVAVQLAQEELRHMEDEPHDLLGVDIHRLTFGPVLGRNPDGAADTLPNITPEAVRAHWKKTYHAGRLQVAAAGPVDVEALTQRLETSFAGLGRSQRDARSDAEYDFTPARFHHDKDLEQQYIAIAMPGATKGSPDYAVEKVLIGILAGGMSGRLFTEVREKQGLVYWVGAWSEQPRGKGVINLGASTTPERVEKTYKTLLHELERISEDLTEEETARARDGLLAHARTEDDLTRARAGGLSDDLFHFSKPIGAAAKMDAIRSVTLEQVEAYARGLQRDQLCVATLGPKKLD